MTPRQIEYQKFLDSPFWKQLSQTKISSTGNECSKCGCHEKLQSHHVRYPFDWYQTTHQDLRVLCHWCHSETHGFTTIIPKPDFVRRPKAKLGPAQLRRKLHAQSMLENEQIKQWRYQGFK